MEAILTKNDAWGYVCGEKVKPEVVAGNVASAEAARAWGVEDKKAKSDIILAIKSSELKQIKGCDTSREVWLKLKSIYQSSGPARKATLLKKLTLHKMDDGGDVHDHLRSYFDTIDKLSEMEIDINRELLTVMLLYSLPPSFANFRCAIESRDELPNPEALRIKIIEEHDARKNETRESSAMFAKKQWGKRLNKNHKFEKESKSAPKCENQSKHEPFKYRCHRCRKAGHKAVDCNEPGKNTDSANAADDVSLCAKAEVTEAFGAYDTNRGGNWCLDSGCTAHMGNDSAGFLNIIESCTGNVKLAGETASTSIQGKGPVSIVAEIEGHPKDVSVRDVLRVPGLRTNLLSVGKITDRGYRVIFEKEKADIVDKDGDTILVADRRNGLYYIREENVEHSANTEVVEGTKAKNATEEWHRKMGHLNVRDLVECDRNGMVQGMNLGKIQEDFDCEICIRGKMTRTPFPKNSTRNSKLLEIVHSDVSGPMRVESNGKAKYVVTFIDDYSRWCEIRLLKRKNEVLNAFKDFKVFAENRHGRKIQFLQSDNGREYRNEAFDKFLRENGIGRRLTVTHTPEQNGVAERRNRTLMDMTRCLLLQSSLPSSFWGEAINTANYIRNRCPSRSLGGRTAYEKWIGETPDVSNFREFGSEVFTLVREPTKGKLDSRSKKGILVGYSNESKAYRIWLPDEKRIDIARDVKFIGMPKTSPNTKDYDEIETNEDDDSPQVEVTIPFRKVLNCDLPDEIDDQINDDIDDNDMEDDQEVDQELPNHEPLRRSRGRPRILRTGLRGRPRKEFHTSNCVEEIEETAFHAEISLEQAVHGPYAEEWHRAIASEMKSIIKNDTWTITERPKDQKVIGSRVVLRNKYKHDGTLDRRKARIVARGFAQRPGVDFNETFAPVARVGSIRTIMALAVENGMTVNQFDITTAYLNGTLEEKVHMEVPKYTAEALKNVIMTEPTNSDVKRKCTSMIDELDKSDRVCLLKKALYGLRQAGRCWNTRINKELLNFGAKKSTADPCVYSKGSGKNLLLISVYVDDFLVASPDRNEITKFGQYLSNIFEVTDLGTVSYCLGMEFNRNEDEITICQAGYVRDILDRFGMSESKSVSTPLDPGIKLNKNEDEPDSEERMLPYRELVGALMYLAVCTRPDIAYAVSYLSQFNCCYKTSHWIAAKRVLRYLQDTRRMGLRFRKTGRSLKGFVDADWANCPYDRKSYTGYAFILAGCPISWEAKKQKTVALSSTEAEYMALSEATKEATYLKRFLLDIDFDEMAQVKILCDNNGARKLAENPVFHNRSKHIDVRHHYVREVLEGGELQIEFTPTNEMAADVLTKGVPKQKHESCLKLLGVTNIELTTRNDP